MWLMASEIPIRLEVLDQAGQRLFDTAARLKNLDDAFAVMECEQPDSRSQIHWGAPVRFELEDGMRRYEITGAVVAHHEEALEAEMCGHALGSLSLPPLEMRIRLWECKLNVQRRTLPRRKVKFPVRYRILCEDKAAQDMDDGTSETRSGWCVDIGAGGIRIRTDRLSIAPSRLFVEFGLPVRYGDRAGGGIQHFCLAARVIRVTPHGRHGDSMEIALKFERLSVKDGLVLNTLLC